jgi:RNA polymerase subunit RPABC4/transcription elongation factor Spt4
MPIPTELLNQIAVTLEVAVACMTALLVAFWIGLVIWTFRDIRARTRDVFAWLLATLLVLVTGPIGLLLYLLLRPRETLAQSYDRQLEEEALLRDITTRRACPSCQAVTEPDWLICPQCGAELRRACEQCSRPLELNWKVCPYCAAPVVKAIEVKTERAALPVGSGYAALERGNHEMPVEPTTATVSDSTTELLPETPAEQEPIEEQ